MMPVVQLGRAQQHAQRSQRQGIRPFAAVVVGGILVFLPFLIVRALANRVWTHGHSTRSRAAGGTPYTRLFHARWIAGGQQSDLLGTADIQTLADLESTCHVVQHMRPVPFTPMSAVVIAAAALAPMIPVALLRVPVAELLKTVAAVVLGKGH